MNQRLILFALALFFTAIDRAETHTPVTFGVTFFTRTNSTGGRIETRLINTKDGPLDGSRLFTGVRLVPTGALGQWLGIEGTNLIRVTADGRATIETVTVSLAPPASLAYDTDRRRVILSTRDDGLRQRSTNGFWSFFARPLPDYDSIAYRPGDQLVWALPTHYGGTNDVLIFNRFQASGANAPDWIVYPPPENIGPGALHSEMVPTEDGSIMVMMEKPYNAEIGALDSSYIFLLHPDFGWYIPAYHKVPPAPPTISFESPTNNASITLGQSFDLHLLYEDPNDDIVSLKLYADGVLFEEFTLDPIPIGLSALNWTWRPNTATNHVLTAVATDSRGATGSASVQVNVNLPDHIGILLTEPTGRVSYQPTFPIALRAYATNIFGSVTISYYAGTNLIASRTGTTQTGFFMDFSQWTNPISGVHIIRAVVDNAGMRATSAPVTISVLFAPNNPTIRFIAPPSSNSIAYVAQPVNVILEFSDKENDITAVDLFDGNSLLRRWAYPLGAYPTNVTRLEYSWIPAIAGTHTLRAVVYDTRQGSGEATAKVTVILAPDIVVERELPPSYSSPIAIEVYLNATPNAAVGAWAIEEQPPAGWTVAKPREATFDPITKKLKWGPFTDTLARRLSYAIMPPTNATTTAVFDGIASADGIAKPITGDREIAYRSPYHPADTNQDRRMTVNEVTAYAAAWKKGIPWAYAPTNIPISYVTRAGSLWKSGEQYRFISTAEAPECWAPLVVTNLLASDVGESLSERKLPPAFSPGRPVQVTLHIRPATGVANYALLEEMPEGWTVIEAGEGTVVSGSLRFGPFYDSQERTFSYNLLPPLSALGGAFRGFASFDGSRERITGDAILRHSHGVAEQLDQRVRLRFNATPGERFEVEATDSLDAKEWISIGTLTGAETPVDFDIIEATGAERFYRLRPTGE